MYKRYFVDGYPGVFYIEGKRRGKTKPNGKRYKEKIYYVIFRKMENGRSKQFEEKVGREFEDDMTPARAFEYRRKRIENELPSPKELRMQAKQKKVYTINDLWDAYKRIRRNKNKSLHDDENRYQKHIGPKFGKMPVEEIRTFDITNWQAKISGQVKPATERNILELLRRIIKFGKDQEPCTCSVKFKMPKVDN